MLTKVEVVSSQSGIPILSLGGFAPHQDLVQIQDIEGIGPVKAEISTTEAPNHEIYQGSNRGKRNIVLKLGANPFGPVQTMSSLRNTLYKYFMPQYWCKLSFFSDDMETVSIEGYVESFVPNLFSKDPEIQISIICPKPDLLGAAVVLNGKTVSDPVYTHISYLGSIETGFDLVIKGTYTGPMSVFMRQGSSPDEVFNMETIVVDGAGHVRLNSIRGSRRIHRVTPDQGNFITSLLKYLLDGSIWPMIKPGDNSISVRTSVANLDWTLSYFNRYGGV